MTSYVTHPKKGVFPPEAHSSPKEDGGPVNGIHGIEIHSG